MRYRLKIIVIITIGIGVVLLTINQPAQAGNVKQQPTLAMPTVTGTVGGITVTVKPDEPQANVRSGPSMDYDKIGVLLAGQSVTAIGRTNGGDWIEIAYPGAAGGVGWVYTYLLSEPPGTLPIVEPPAPPKPQMTATIDPTLASQFIVTAVPSRLPTFTAAPPFVNPTLPGASGTAASSRIPMGMVIAILGGLGIFLGLVSLIRGK